DIDELSKKVPHICKVAPSCHYHVQDVNRAGGIMTILGELNRHGLLDTSVKRVDYPSLAQAISDYDIRGGKYINEALEVFLSAPSMMKNNTMGYHNTMYTELDTDTANGCIRDFEHAYNKDGGLAVLYGNIAKNGCIVKTAGVDESLYTFSGPAIVFESQEDAVNGILGDKVKAGDVVIIRYEGPKGGPGMQEMLYPTSYIKSKGLGKKCALITDGRFSGGTSGLSIGHVSPEAANKGLIAVVKDGDIIDIDIPNRRINIRISDAELDVRMAAEEKDKMAFKPKKRDRVVPASLKADASMVSSADSGAVRIVE
ncbi:MAG: dihydroxy-acid dehydratase, partial [Bacteroidales bacterium]|nr:dihydroxy-acid dehydratase [Bacteroidales bacterium]